MSGQQIGTVVGFAVGWMVGAPQAGAMIGGFIGGAIDPEKIRSPDGRDAQEQTTTDGIPIPVVWGSPSPFMGTVMDGENKSRRIKGKFQSGKGGPEVQDPDTYLWTGAILICEGPISGVSFIVRNGVLVYDKRPNPKIPPSETAKFESKIRIYLGTESQNPDPALEAMHGVGNTPYYRGRAYIVIVDDDVTETAGVIAKYAFGVVKQGQTQTVTVTTYAQPRMARFVNADWPLADDPSFYDYTGYLGVGAGTVSHSGSSVGEIIDYFRNYDYSAVGGGSRDPRHYLGYSASTGSGTIPGIGLNISTLGVSNAVEQPDVRDGVAVVLVFNDFIPTVTHAGIGFDSSYCSIDANSVVQDRRGTVAKKYPATPGGQLQLMRSCGDPDLYGYYQLCIRVTPKRITAPLGYGDPCDLLNTVLLPDSASHSIDCNGLIQSAAALAYLPSGLFWSLSVPTTAIVDGRQVYATKPIGPVLPNSDPNAGNQAFWESAYAIALAAGDVPEGWVYGSDYPSAQTGSYTFSQTTTSISPDEVFLREVQEEIAARCDVPANRIDASELAIPIPGFMVATASTGANASRALQPVFFYDMPEYDGKIRCVRRGKPAVLTLTDDDFVDVEDDDEDIRSQQIEFPKAIHLAYPDPELNYAITKQTFSREASSVISVDEEIATTTIPFDGDTAAKVVDIMGKVSWAGAEGRMKCVLPRDFTLLTPADAINFNGKRFVITKAEYDSYATIKLEATYDRASNYTSIATSKDSRPPGSQTSNLRGPTRLETINLSPLLDSQDRLGLYFAVCGILEGWAGGTVSASIDGGANFQTLGTWRDASVMGHTTTHLPAGSPWVFDPLAEVTVHVHGGEPDSATFLQLLNEANACVIGDEAYQFMDAIEVDERTFRLVGLTCARHGTSASAHPVHSRFVLLGDSLKFVELQASWIGRTITLHVQSLGTPAGTGYTEAIVWNPANAQAEWPPFHFTADHDGTRARIGWIGRARLGSTAAPFHSSFFDGYRVTLTDGTTTVTHTTTDQHFDYTDAQRTTDFGSLDPLDVSVVALNRITGASAPLTGTI